MISTKEQILQILEDLPEPKLREVLEIVESLAWEQANHVQQSSNSNPMDDPILSVLGIATGVSMTNDEIDEELYGPYLLGDEASTLPSKD